VVQVKRTKCQRVPLGVGQGSLHLPRFFIYLLLVEAIKHVFLLKFWSKWIQKHKLPKTFIVNQSNQTPFSFFYEQMILLYPVLTVESHSFPEKPKIPLAFTKCPR